MEMNPQILATWIVILLYAAIILFFVIRGALRIKDMKDYAVGNMNFSPAFVGLSLAAAMTSAATFVINPGFIANYGISALLSYGVFFPLASLVSLVVLTKSFRRFGSASKALSLASWLGNRYQSNSYRLFIAILSALLITFIVLILVAVTKVIANALAINEVYTLAFLVIFVFGYMMFGGANAMVYTNTIQAMIMIAVAIILIGSGYKYLTDGFSGLAERLSAIDPLLLGTTYEGSPLFRDMFEIMIAQMVVGAAVVCQPHIITKSLLLKNEQDVNKYLITAGIIQMLFFSVVVAGLWGRLEFPDLMVNGKPLGVDGVISAYVVKIFASGFIAISIGLLVIVGLVSAGLSTIEGLIQSLSTTITNDIFMRFGFVKNLSDKKQIIFNRLVIAIMALVAFWLSREQLLHPNLSVAIFAQNGVYSFFSIVFVPILLGIFTKNLNRTAAVTASVVALIMYFTTYYLLPWMVSVQGFSMGFLDTYISGKVQNPAISATVAIVLSLIAGVGIHYFHARKLQTVKN